MAWTEEARTSSSWTEEAVGDPNGYEGADVVGVWTLGGFYYGGGVGERVTVTMPWTQTSRQSNSWSEIPIN